MKFTPPTTAASECNFLEIQIIGRVFMDDSNDDKTCAGSLKRGTSEIATQASAVVYKVSKTPVVNALSLRSISVAGGESVTISGVSMLDTVSSIKIDEVACASTASSATSITCTTGARTALKNSTLVLETPAGYTYNSGLKFRYVHKWSDENTWSGEFAPKDGDSIFIPSG